MDYGKLRLKVGLEIHQELATQHKLFCSCPPRLSDSEPKYSFLRKLRPSQSELGEVDPAALFEFLKGKTIKYVGDRATSCLVEMDEEPPGPLNAEALDIALTFALLVNSHPVDEVHVMRKIVVDGSNTGGFQRTCIVSLGGSVEVEGKRYGLNQICLEEDAARNIGEEDDTLVFSLDRLGIPLMEITTAPDMHLPDEVQAVALRIGIILRATEMVRRGLGTIRQDLNVSILDGPVVEIKGVQDLALIPTIVEYEARRQFKLHDIKNILNERGITESDILNKQFDVSNVFVDTESKVIRSALKNGGIVNAIRLPGFSGLTGMELCPGRRLGTELLDHAKYGGGVKGLFHTDELPGYSVTQEEVNKLRMFVGAEDKDAVLLIADEAIKTKKALLAVLERAREAIKGIPLETRAANSDGTTRFTRPRPGAARMYPETDVHLITIKTERVESLRLKLPEMPEARLRRFIISYGLNEKLARQIVESEYLGLFMHLATKFKGLSILAAVTLTEDLKKLQREGIPINSLTDEAIEDAFSLLASGNAVKESLPEVLAWMSKSPGKPAAEALSALGLNLLTQTEISAFIDEKIRDNSELLRKMGEKAAGPLMGIIMGELRGRARAQDVQIAIAKRLKMALIQLTMT